jgi:cell division protein FtsB
MIHPPRHHSRRPTPEERRFLDALVFWRAIYAERGPQDSRSTISVERTIAAAEQSMRMLQARDDQLRRRFYNG